MLYLLTFADVKAVGPDVWNPWKASLLGELYVKALALLEEAEKGELRREDVRAALRRIEARVRRELSKDHDVERVDHFIASMPDRYFLSTAEDDIPVHFELMEKFNGKGAVTAVEHSPERDCSSVVVCTQDRPGLFAAITGVFTSMNLDILNARIFTSMDGRILDVFRVSHHGRSDVVMAEQKWTKFRAILDGVLDGRIDVSTVIEIDNGASDNFTIIEVFTEDRIGVLFTITHGLHRLGLSIHVAKISTNVDQVADIFYVADENGKKIEAANRVAEIRESLYQSLAPQNERVAQSGH
jgi:[protein-PII] uridylyltransferase